MAQEPRIVGIDVAKEKIDAAIRSIEAAQSFDNTPAGRRQFVAWLKKHQVGKAVMEASGGYERVWTKVLHPAGIEVRIVDPKRVRHFAKSAGRLAKNDAIDAQTIAWFAETFAEAPGRAPDADREELDQLVSARTHFNDLLIQVGNYQEHDQPAELRKAHRAISKTILAELSKIEAAIETRIEKTEQFAERAEIIQSVPGLGDISAAGIIAFMPEMGSIGNKAAAALVGLAPYDDDSGRHHGRRFIKGGRQKLRTLLYMPIVAAATRCNPVLKACYQRLIAKGKAPKVALIACMRKLIVILNVMLTRKEKWDPAKHALA